MHESMKKLILGAMVLFGVATAQVNAQKITLNGKTLLEDKLKPENLLKQLSSEYNLNEAQISQVKAELTNKEWYDKTTTLSQMGMIIVQAAVTVLTAGAGTAFVAGIDATVDAMVNAAINSMITQTLTQLATAAITGNKLDLDINTLLTFNSSSNFICDLDILLPPTARVLNKPIWILFITDFSLSTNITVPVFKIVSLHKSYPNNTSLLG